jgi:hypothetical protein
VGQSNEFSRVPTLFGAPGLPDELDASPRVHEHSIEIEEDRATGERLGRFGHSLTP